jgi:hypothetical protein
MQLKGRQDGHPRVRIFSLGEPDDGPQIAGRHRIKA